MMTEEQRSTAILELCARAGLPALAALGFIRSGLTARKVDAVIKQASRLCEHDDFDFDQMD